MTLIEKRISFSRKTTFLELYLICRGIKYAVDWVKRDVITQTRLVNEGRSRTMKSAHIRALAKDYLLFDDDNNYITDGDHKYYLILGSAAERLGLVWGGRWDMDKDKPGIQSDAGHVQLGVT